MAAVDDLPECVDEARGAASSALAAKTSVGSSGRPAASSGGDAPMSSAGAGAAEPAGELVGMEVAAKAMGDVLPSDPLAARIQGLRIEQAALKATRKRLANDLRNAERKKKRLRARARQLTDTDLVAVMMMRKTQRQARANPGGAASSSKDPPPAGSSSAPASAGSGTETPEA